MSLVPTAVTPVDTPPTTPTTPHGLSPAATRFSRTPKSTKVSATPTSKIRLFNRTAPNSPHTPAIRSTSLSPLASPYTEPRFRNRSSAGSAVESSSVGAGLLLSLNEAAKSGDVDAQFNLAMSYSFGKGVEQNFETALTWFLKCANQNDARAQYYLAVMYSNGHGTQIDPYQAAYWYSKSASQGDADAQCDLGIMYLKGEGLTKNETEAVTCFRKAADQSHPDAQHNLAVSFEIGEGVEKDLSQAAFWYRKAAEQGYRDAQIQIERLYVENLIDEKDKADTLHWFQKLAEQNVKFAQEALIYFYLNGQGLPQNLTLATFWVLRSSLENESTIKVTEDNFDLIKFIPTVFKNFTEFNRIEKLEFQSRSLSNENVIAISELIQMNTSIELLNLTDIPLGDTDGLSILQSLKGNTKLTDLFFDCSNINEGILLEIQSILDQNITIAEARRYAKNHEFSHLIANSTELPPNFLDNIIVESINSGLGLRGAKQAIDNFLTNTNHDH